LARRRECEIEEGHIHLDHLTCSSRFLPSTRSRR
jgi:hypothetical protein